MAEEKRWRVVLRRRDDDTLHVMLVRAATAALAGAAAVKRGEHQLGASVQVMEVSDDE